MESEKLRDFLQRIWEYTSLKAMCYAVVWFKDKKPYFKHYCLPIFTKMIDNEKVVLTKGYDDLYDKVIDDVRNLLATDNSLNIYFQVLPLEKPPRSGRGSSKDVSVAKFLFVDIDYKSPAAAMEFEGCKSGGDYALQCYYYENEKLYRVNRPPLSTVLKQVGIEPSIVVDSGCGYHLYFELDDIIDVSKWVILENRLVEYLKSLGIAVDEQVKDPARILRMPETINQRCLREVKVIYQGEKKYSVEELDKILYIQKEKSEAKITTSDNLRLLSDAQLVKIKELIKDAYRPGNRQDLALFLAGWLAQARVHPLQAMKLIKWLYDETGDHDELKERLGAVVYSYKKVGINVDKYAEQIEQEFGVKPYGLEKEIDESKVKGKSGVLEILERIYGEGRALDTVRQIEDILQTASPYSDSVTEILDYEKQLFAIANLRKLIVARAKLTKEGMLYKEKVTVGCPTRVEVFFNALGGITKYKVIWETPTRPKPLEIGPVPREEIIARLNSEGLVLHKRLVDDVVNAIIEGFIRKGRAVIRSEVESPGFYLLNDKITPVGITIEDVNTDELREAFILLNELDKWYQHVEAKFAMAIKWGIIAPFSFVYKQRGSWLKWLFLYGTAGAGKTTVGEIILSIWGLGSQYIKSGGNIDSPARMGFVLSQSTFPVLVNEPANVFDKVDLVEIIKNAIETTVVRGRYVHGTYTEIPSLAPIIFTSNMPLPRDDAIQRRFIKLHFSFGEKESIEDKKKEFEMNIKPRLKKLSAIGKFVAKYVVERQELDNEWEKLAIKILEEAYKTAGLPVPSWIYLRHEEVEEDDIRLEIIESIRNKLTSAYITFIGKLPPGMPSDITNENVNKREMVLIVLKHGLLPGLYLKKKPDGLYVLFTKKFADELSKEFPQITSLKSFAEIFGWQYGKERILKETPHVAMVRLDKLIELLYGGEEEEVEETATAE